MLKILRHDFIQGSKRAGAAEDTRIRKAAKNEDNSEQLAATTRDDAAPSHKSGRPDPQERNAAPLHCAGDDSSKHPGATSTAAPPPDGSAVSPHRFREALSQSARRGSARSQPRGQRHATHMQRQSQRSHRLAHLPSELLPMAHQIALANSSLTCKQAGPCHTVRRCQSRHRSLGMLWTTLRTHCSAMQCIQQSQRSLGMSTGLQTRALLLRLSRYRSDSVPSLRQLLARIGQQPW